LPIGLGKARRGKISKYARGGIRTHGLLRDRILSPAPLAGLATLATLQYLNGWYEKPFSPVLTGLQEYHIYYIAGGMSGTPAGVARHSYPVQMVKHHPHSDKNQYGTP
jgi:hypothetical protein